MPWTSLGAHKRVICFLPSTILSGARRLHPRNTAALTFCYRVRRFGFCIVLLTTGAVAQNTFPATGNVGIGTTVPSGNLSIVGDFAGSGAWLTLQGSGTGGENWLIQSTDGTASQGQGSLVFYNLSNGVNPLTMTVGGHVGIGTNSPSSPLEVFGSVKLSSGSGGGIIFPDGTTQTTAAISNTATASPGVTNGIVSSSGTSSPLVAWDAITAQVTNPSTANGPVFNGYSSTPAINVTDGTSRIVIGGAFSPSLVATGGSTSSIYGVNSIATIGSPSATGGYSDLYGGAFSAGTSPTAPTTTTVANVAGIKSGVQIDSGSVGLTRGLLVESTFGSTSGPANVTTLAYYGLQLTTPVYANGASIIANWGISQEDSAAKNYLAGQVGIGTMNPGAPLEVNGTGIKLTAGSGGSITFQDGTVQSTA
jgi:hypothetical protein